MFHFLNVPGGQRRLAEELSEDALMCPSLHPAAVKPRKLQTFLCVQKLFKNIRLSVLHCLSSISSDILFMSHWWQVLNWIKGKLCCHELCFAQVAEKNSSRQNKAGRREERIKDAPNRRSDALLETTKTENSQTKMDFSSAGHEAAAASSTRQQREWDITQKTLLLVSQPPGILFYFVVRFGWTLKPLRSRVHVAQNQTGQKYYQHTVKTDK